MCSTSALESMPACSNLKVFSYSLQTAEQGSPYSPAQECSPMPRFTRSSGKGSPTGKPIDHQSGTPYQNWVTPETAGMASFQDLLAPKASNRSIQVPYFSTLQGVSTSSEARHTSHQRQRGVRPPSSTLGSRGQCRPVRTPVRSQLGISRRVVSLRGSVGVLTLCRISECDTSMPLIRPIMSLLQPNGAFAAQHVLWESYLVCEARFSGRRCAT